MAETTKKSLRNQVMYQIFVRNFSVEGTFSKVTPELDRIRNMGVDIVWFAPIHPIGNVCRKGSLGSPYAISDYRSINPEYGSLQDFRDVVNEIHKRGMKCIIDVVYNHTSPDSLLVKEHPEWFYHKNDGSMGNHVGDWTDIVDLDYTNKELWDYQIETLKMWAEIVDGFRCDVAPLIPLEFWKKAREEVDKVRKDCIWLSESIDPEFILFMRENGLTALSDSEVFQAFDISYDYDVYGELIRYVTGKGTLERYAESISRQEYIYPDNYVKLRFLENHDQPRARFLFPDLRALRNATAFLLFQKGMTLIYAGQEFGVKHLPSLFDKDTVDWDNSENENLQELIKTLATIKKNELFAEGTYRVIAIDNAVIHAEYRQNNKKAIGIFMLRDFCGPVSTDLEDGTYVNLIDNRKLDVSHGMLSTNGDPVIIFQQ